MGQIRHGSTTYFYLTAHAYMYERARWTCRGLMPQPHQGVQVRHQTLTDGHLVTTQLIALSFQTPLFQTCVQIIKAVIMRRGHHEVATCISDHTLYVVFVAPSRWPPELVIKQIVRL